MKTITLFAFALHLSAFAAVPLRWTVETTRAQPATFEAYQGETLTFEAHLKANGKPLEAPSNYSFFWQTNGMGSTYWEKEVEVGSRSRTEEFDNSTVGLRASTSTNVLFATWSPEMDVGAKVYNCFIGSPSNNYHAAFQLRLRPSPGATPNALPLPVPVIDFAKVRVLNPPWESGGGVDTNAVVDIIRKTVSGSARQLPKYLWLADFDDSYPEAAQEYYRSRGDGKTDGGCSAVRSGGFLYRNFDFPFDDRAEFVVRCVATAPSPSCPSGRFASIGVAQVGTNLTEQIVASGMPEYSARYKWLPGATVDGINSEGVACNINVVDGEPQWRSGVPAALQIHPLAAVRWALDHATNAAHAAEHLAANIAFPDGWTQNFHYMVCDATSTYIVENGSAHAVTDGAKVLTNFRLCPTRDTTGEGQERYDALAAGADITSQWWTRTYTPSGYRASDLPGITGEALTQLFDYWASKPRESHRGESFHSTTTTSNYSSHWWQTVHTSVYDLANRTLRIAVQETDDWYVFAVPSAGGVKPEAVREIVAPMLDAKLDGPTVAPSTGESASGKAADAKATGDRFDALRFLGYTSDDYRYKVFLSHDEDPEYSTLSFGDLFPFYDFGTGQIWCGTVFSARGGGFYTHSLERFNRIAMNYDGFTAPNGWDAGGTAYFTAGKLNGDDAPDTGDWNQFRRLTRVTGDTMIYEGLGDVLDNFATKDDTYTKDETDALIAENKPEYEDIPSNVVWRIEAEGGRFFFKPVRPINMED